jgi:hypothetical protein
VDRGSNGIHQFILDHGFEKYHPMNAMVAKNIAQALGERKEVAGNGTLWCCEYKIQGSRAHGQRTNTPIRTSH